MILRLVALSILLLPLAAEAQTAVGVSRRPIPYPVVPVAGYRQAIENGTRTENGLPGPKYWQQWADYTIRARLMPDTKRLEGRAIIHYQNNSPDSLAFVLLNLLQNHHAPGVQRIQGAELTGGIEINSLTVDGVEITATADSPAAGLGPPQGVGYTVSDTRLRVVPENPIAPGTTVEIALDYGFRIPQAGASGRMGYSRDNLIYLAYWYPQMAVYDDVIGWHFDRFLGNAEFYAGFGNYDVTLDVPAGWLIRGTGELANPEETLTGPVLARFREAAASDEIVRVVNGADGSATLDGDRGRLAWHFQADSVHDVAYSATTESNWDVTRTPVGDRDGDGQTDYARIESVWRDAAPRWEHTARYAQHSIRALSDYTGFPYPWPHMTAVEGEDIIGGGMEYPMITLIGSYTATGDTALYAVTAHELAHMWIPMTISNNERRYAWFDEGATTFNENQIKKDFYRGFNWDLPDQDVYMQVAAAELEGEIMRLSDLHAVGPAYTIASYQKPSTALAALRGVIGEQAFNKGWHALFDRWAFKHAYPWDMWNTFEDVSGRDLDWFWRSWYYETWTLDHAITDVVTRNGQTTITIEDQGWIPMPVDLVITMEDGSTLRRTVPVEVWLEGAVSTTVTVDGDVARVEIDPEFDFPDVDRDDNVWER